jgi:hypothetical protein
MPWCANVPAKELAADGPGVARFVGRVLPEHLIAPVSRDFLVRILLGYLPAMRAARSQLWAFDYLAARRSPLAVRRLLELIVLMGRFREGKRRPSYSHLSTNWPCSNAIEDERRYSP